MNKYWDEKVVKDFLTTTQYSGYSRYVPLPMLFAKTLLEFGVKEMAPTISWTAGKKDEWNHIQVHPCSYIFRPYVGVQDMTKVEEYGYVPKRPLPWFLADHFKIRFCGGASEEFGEMQACFNGFAGGYRPEDHCHNRLNTQNNAMQIYLHFNMLKGYHGID